MTLDPHDLRPAVPDRPLLAFRVGVTGRRKLPTDQEAQLRAQVAAVLRLVRQEIALLAKEPAVLAAYRREADGTVQPRLHLLSPLAQGADRLGARAGLGEGFDLRVVMPFACAEYEVDFAKKPGSLDAFRTLLGRAEPPATELDGSREEEARSYQAVGRFVVRNCDLLIAIWDGKPDKGLGGTAGIVRFATRFGPPVWWIHTDPETPPALVDDPLELCPNPPRRGSEAEAALRRLLRETILPPTPPREHAHGLLAGLADCRGDRDRTPVATYLAERRPPDRRWWHIHAATIARAAWIAANIHYCHRLCRRHPLRSPHWLAVCLRRCVMPPHERRLLAPASPQPSESPRPDRPVLAYWERFYADADHRAGDYANRYRSSYVLIFALAALALIAAVLAAAAGGWLTWFMAAVELAALAAVLGLVWANHRQRWHQRWIEYRLLAELCRKQQALARVGWSLAAWEVRGMTGDTAPRTQTAETAPPRTAWVSWFFNAAMRASPLPVGALSGDGLRTIREALAEAPAREQWGYHLKRGRLCTRAAQCLGSAGEALFLLTLLFVVAELALSLSGSGHSTRHALGVLAAMAPALSAALFGIRAYAELELLAGQSARLAANMRSAMMRIRSVDLTRPLASQELGAEAYEVATTMLHDIEGWAQLFGVKAVEAA